MSTTVEQLEALPEGAVVRSGSAGHWTWIRSGDMWTCHELQSSKYSGELWDTERGNDGLQILYPQPEPDHSMRARLVWVDIDGGFWTLEHPVRARFTGKYTTDEAHKLGYLLPVPALTVEERVVEALQSAEWGLFPTANKIAARLAELGLLAKNEEGDA